MRLKGPLINKEVIMANYLIKNHKSKKTSPSNNNQNQELIDN